MPFILDTLDDIVYDLHKSKKSPHSHNSWPPSDRHTHSSRDSSPDHRQAKHHSYEIVRSDGQLTLLTRAPEAGNHYTSDNSLKSSRYQTYPDDHHHHEHQSHHHHHHHHRNDPDVYRKSPPPTTTRQSRPHHPTSHSPSPERTTTVTRYQIPHETTSHQSPPRLKPQSAMAKSHRSSRELPERHVHWAPEPPSQAASNHRTSWTSKTHNDYDGATVKPRIITIYDDDADDYDNEVLIPEVRNRKPSYDRVRPVYAS